MNLLILAVSPSLAIILLFYLRDKYDREPLGLIVKTFILGALTVFPLAWIEGFLFKAWDVDFFAPVNLADPGNAVAILLAMLFLVALFEEGAKLIVVRFYAWKKPAFNEPYDGIMYTVMASLGFATVENILYVINYGFEVGVIRALLTVPMHALTAVIMGYYIGLAKYTKDREAREGKIFTGLWLAILFHGFFNWFVSSNMILLLAMAPALIAYVWYVGLRASRIHALASPFRKKS